uniref:Cyclic nucleotide-binding domain-containing protein n=2 Tax=Schistocephalus solidus TaxID=70667 RepID=A0A0V0J2R5_SCHSO
MTDNDDDEEAGSRETSMKPKAHSFSSNKAHEIRQLTFAASFHDIPTPSEFPASGIELRAETPHDPLNSKYSNSSSVVKGEFQGHASDGVVSSERSHGKPWRKIKNAFIVSSIATSMARRQKARDTDNDTAFLEYFSTRRSLSAAKHPRAVSYPNYQMSLTSNAVGVPFIKGSMVSGSPQLPATPPVTCQPDRQNSDILLMDHRKHSHRTSVPNENFVYHEEVSSAPSSGNHVIIQNTNGLSTSAPRNSPNHRQTFIQRALIWFFRVLCYLPARFLCLPTGDKLHDTTSERPTIKNRFFTDCIISPQGSFFFMWLGIVTLATVYNLWSTILRQAFAEEVQAGRALVWIVLDGLADLIYVTDIVVQFRTSYLEKGLVVKNSRKIAQHYVWTKAFFLDLLALLPLDIFQLFIGVQPLLRFPRFLKCWRAWDWKVMVENRTSYPNAWRVFTLIHILFLGCHWFASFYYLISEYDKFEDEWGYPAPTTPALQSLSMKYLQSFYWATLTLTTIGDINPPSQKNQFAFTAATYLIGVFVFATIVGQVGNIINNRNAARLSFEQILDNAKFYMNSHKVPKGLRTRVLRWYDYAWQRRQLFGENDLSSLGLLPDKLKTELALHVHLETLKKVTIFHECRPEFLHDLVLKMKPYIFTPGDLICRNGEVAREMFIVADGVLEVIGKTGIVIKRLGVGDFFGEIGILCINAGANKRTADVRAVGYAELFVLSREDVLSALADHPDAHAIIVEHATKRLMESRSREDAEIGLRPQTSEAVPSDPTSPYASSNIATYESPNVAHEDDYSPQPHLSESSVLQQIPSTSFPSNQPLPSTSQPPSFKRKLLDDLDKEAHQSIATFTKCINETMSLLNMYASMLSARDERINALEAEKASLRALLARYQAFKEGEETNEENGSV